jgi:DNA-binding transcriptional regulator YdaS (Cro superfamily)
MNLQALFATYPKTTIAAIARQAGTSLGYLEHVTKGRRRMSADLAILLEHATGGELTARELRPDLPWPGQCPAHRKDATPN